VNHPDEKPDGVRLQKVLAQAGVASRRAAEELIAAGRVSVDGKVVREMGRRVDPETAVVHVDGGRISLRDDVVHLALNKPFGMLSTMADDQGRPCVGDLVMERAELLNRAGRLFHVGRLDAETEGLLILTNDGDLAHRLSHPSFGVEKEYLAEVEGTPTARELKKLRSGVELEDGITAPARASVVQERALRLTIHEGRNRQVRRMCAAIGHPVVRLVRTRIGPLADRDLKPGRWRLLTLGEVRALEESVATPRPTP